MKAERYEYDMALDTARVLAATGWAASAIHYAVLESFLVHARNLPT
jgi:hypothetical protein